MNWIIPNVDPYVDYLFKEFARWIAENAVTILLLTNFLTLLQKKAIKMEEIKDNRMTSLMGYWLFGITKFLLYILTGKWILQFRTKVNEK
jgi:hypothetical protein